MCFGGGGSAEDIAEAQRRDEIARQKRIKEGMARIASIFDSNFNDSFYNKRASDYLDYVMPDINRQASSNREKLIYALARTGNLDSSAANRKNAELIEEANKARVGAANEAQNQANQLRNSVEQTRSSLVAEVNATGDATAAGNNALRQVQNLNQPAGFSPLGNLFLNFADSVARIGNRATNYSGFMGGGGTPLFSTGGGSARVVG